jgi:hypothetical protein
VDVTAAAPRAVIALLLRNHLTLLQIIQSQSAQAAQAQRTQRPAALIQFLTPLHLLAVVEDQV